MIEHPRQNITAENFFNARMLSKYSFERLFQEYLERQLEKINIDGCLQKYYNDDKLNEALELVENNEQAYVIEIVVGKGNNSQQ